MDIVYNPRDTRLLKDAKAAGCRVIPGLEMFLASSRGAVRALDQSGCSN